MKYYGYIYKTTNLRNNRIYIGQNKGKFKINYFGSGIIIKQAIKKEGRQVFKLEIIVYAKNKIELDKLEKSYIAKFRKQFGKNKLYNLTDGGHFEGRKKGIPHKKNCKCPFCKNKRKETHPKNCKCITCLGKCKFHQINCQCNGCKKKRGEPLNHSKNCQCTSCRSHHGKYVTHKQNCQCFICKNKRGIPHKKDCQCSCCTLGRGEKHRVNCQCASCKSRRGEKMKSVHKMNCKCFVCKNHKKRRR